LRLTAVRRSIPRRFGAVTQATPRWKTKGREPEADLAGLRDRALLLIGFVGALRRSEIVGLDLDHVADHPNGSSRSRARRPTRPARKPRHSEFDASVAQDW
jgi:integrase